MAGLNTISCRVFNVLHFSFNSQRRFCKTAASFYISKPKLERFQHHWPLTATQVPYSGCYTRKYGLSQGSLFTPTARHYAIPAGNQDPCPDPKPDLEPKPSLYQRFKTMYRDYWYVLLPVHLVTSAAWFGGFYYMASSGVDIVSLLEKLNVSDKLINPFRNGHATTGYLAISYALYKIATPLRYTVTLGGTTVSINYLRKWGYIKPVPSKEKLKEIYEGKKEIIRERGQSLKDNMMQTFKPAANTITTKGSSRHINE